jgi:hypothetical protein
MGSKDTSYNMPTTLILEGRLDVERLEWAFRELIHRHESLRTSFQSINEEFVQIIHPEVEFSLDYLVSDSEDNIEALVRGMIRPFHLNEAPLFRVGLIQLPTVEYEGKERFLLFYDIHHIISDGVTMSILVKEVFALYQGMALPELRIQYKDFAAWQNKLFSSDAMKRQEEYWLTRFAGEIPALNLFTDYPRPPIQNFEGDTIYSEIDEELTGRWKEYILTTESTLYISLLAVYNVLLYKYTDQEDIIVGSPITGRSHPDLENIVGMFVNMLSMRNYPEKDMTFREFLHAVRDNSLNAFQHQDYQFEELVRNVKIKRDMSRNPLFSVVFALQNVENESLATPDFRIVPYRLKSEMSKFDLLLDAAEVSNRIRIKLDFKTSLFKKATAEKIMENYLYIIRQVVADDTIRLGEIRLTHSFLTANSVTDLQEQSEFAF